MKNVAKTLPRIVETATFPGQDPDFSRFGLLPLVLEACDLNNSVYMLVAPVLLFILIIHIIQPYTMGCYQIVIGGDNGG